MSWWLPAAAGWDSRARLGLVALPPAGASATSFQPWQGRLPPGVQLAAVQWPGRGARYREPALATWEARIDALGQAVLHSLRIPLCVFGHSAGALAAFELAHWLAARGRAPQLLMVSGCRPPQSVPTERRSHDDDATLADWLAGLGGTADAALDDPELRALVLEPVRADLRLHESHVCPPRPPLELPIAVFGGRRDPAVDFTGLPLWAAQTRGTFELHAVDGGHFYLDQPGFLAHLRQLLVQVQRTRSEHEPSHAYSH